MSCIRLIDDAFIAQRDGRLGSKSIYQILVEGQPQCGYQYKSLENVNGSILLESTGCVEFMIISIVYFILTYQLCTRHSLCE